MSGVSVGMRSRVSGVIGGNPTQLQFIRFNSCLPVHFVHDSISIGALWTRDAGRAGAHPYRATSL